MKKFELFACISLYCFASRRRIELAQYRQSALLLFCVEHVNSLLLLLSLSVQMIQFTKLFHSSHRGIRFLLRAYAIPD